MSSRPTMREAFEAWFAQGTFESLGDDWEWAAFQAGAKWKAALAEPEAQMPELPEHDAFAELDTTKRPDGGYETQLVPAWSEPLVRAYGQACADAARAAAPQDAVERFKSELLRLLEEPDAELLKEFQRGFLQQLRRRKHKPESESAEMAGAREMFKLAMTRAKAAAP